MKKIHLNTTIGIFLSFVSFALSAYYFFTHPAFDLRLIASVISLLAFGAAMSEFKKYSSNFQFAGLFLAMISLGISIDHRLPAIPFVTIAMTCSFITNAHYFGRKWVAETDFLYLNLFLVAASLSSYVYGNLHYGYGWKGWILPAFPLILFTVFTFQNFFQLTGTLKYNKGKKQNVEAGKPAPAFSLNDIKGELISLSDFRDKRHVLIVFIRSDWCPSCRIKLRTYEKHREKFMEKDVQLLTISPSSAEANREMVMNIGIDFNVLCDTTQEVAKNYGVQLPVEVVGEKYNPGLPLPASFLIDKKGIVRYTSRPDRIGEFLDPTTIFPALEKLS